MNQNDFLKEVKRRYVDKSESRLVLELPWGIACFTNNKENEKVVSSDRVGVLKSWEEGVRWADGDTSVIPHVPGPGTAGNFRAN